MDPMSHAGFFRPRIAEVKPALQEMDSEHSLQTDRGTTFARFGVEGFDEGAELLPGNDPFHLGQKLLPPCRFPVLLEGHGIGKGLLALHLRSSPVQV